MRREASGRAYVSWMEVEERMANMLSMSGTSLSRIVITPLPAPAHIAVDQAWLHPTLPASPAIAQGDLRLVEIRVCSYPRSGSDAEDGMLIPAFLSSTAFASRPRFFSTSTRPAPLLHPTRSSFNSVRLRAKIFCASLVAPYERFGRKT